MHEALHRAAAIDLLRTCPGVGLIVSVVIAPQGGAVRRYEGPEPLACDARTPPCVPASGGKTCDGPRRPPWVSRFAMSLRGGLACQQSDPPGAPRRPVHWFSERPARPEGHQKAIGAVARHLAEATYGMLTKGRHTGSRTVHGTRARRRRKRELGS
jgi:hypothetical protein